MLFCQLKRLLTGLPSQSSVINHVRRGGKHYAKTFNSFRYWLFVLSSFIFWLVFLSEEHGESTETVDNLNPSWTPIFIRCLVKRRCIFHSTGDSMQVCSILAQACILPSFEVITLVSPILHKCLEYWWYINRLSLWFCFPGGPYFFFRYLLARVHTCCSFNLSAYRIPDSSMHDCFTCMCL